MLMMSHRYVCFFLSILTTIISIDCALCAENKYEARSDNRLIVSTIEGSVLILRKMDGKVLLNLKGKALIEGFNHMRDKYELLLGTAKGRVQFKKLSEGNYVDNPNNIETSLSQLTTNGYEFGSDLISLSSHKDSIHFIDLQKLQIKSVTTFNIDEPPPSDSNSNNAHELAIKYAEPQGTFDYDYENDRWVEAGENILPIEGEEEEDVKRDTETQFTLMQRSYQISVYNLEERKELGRLNYIVYPQLETAKYTNDKSTYFFSIHSNKLASVNLMTSKLNWLVRLDSHLISIGQLHTRSNVSVKQLAINFVTEKIMQQILLRIENNENLDVFQSMEFINNNLQHFEILSESNGVKLYFDKSLSQGDNCEHSQDNECRNIISKTDAYNPYSVDGAILPPHIIQNNNNIINYNHNSEMKFSPNITSNIIDENNCGITYIVVRFKHKMFALLPVSEHILDSLITLTVVLVFGVTFAYVYGNYFNIHRKKASLYKSPQQCRIEESLMLESSDQVNYLNMEFKVEKHLQVALKNVQLTTFIGMYKSKKVTIKRYENIIEKNNHKNNGLIAPNYLSSSTFKHEVQILGLIPFNKHLIKLVGTEVGVRYSYIITDLYGYNLETFFNKTNNSDEPISLKVKINMIYQLLKGIKHLHTNQYSHGRLLPINILIDVNTNTQQLRLVISNFSSCQYLSDISNCSSDDSNPQIQNPIYNVKNFRCSSKTYFSDSKPILTDALKHTANDIHDFAMLSIYILFEAALPKNNDIFEGELPKNNDIFEGELPKNNEIFEGELPKNNEIFEGELPQNNEIFEGELSEHNGMIEGKLSEHNGMIEGKLSEHNGMIEGKFLTDNDIDWANITSDGLGNLLKPCCESATEEVVDLIRECFSANITERSSAHQLINHPLFWNSEKRGLFISEISNYLESMVQTNSIIKSLERNSCRIVRGYWTDFVIEDIMNDMTKRRTYRGDSIKDLLRVIRNMRNHFTVTCPKVSSRFKTADQLTEYFMQQFPMLIIYVYIVLKQFHAEEVPTLAKFFVSNSNS